MLSKRRERRTPLKVRMADVKNPFDLLDAGDENADPEQIAAAAAKVTAAKPAAAPAAAAKPEAKGELLLHSAAQQLPYGSTELYWLQSYSETALATA